MTILPVISPKGGEGKSTFAAYLAGFLADAGLNTLLVDAMHFADRHKKSRCHLLKRPGRTVADRDAPRCRWPSSPA